MANTNPKAFKEFLSIISAEVLENVWFIALRANSKQPHCPAGSVLRGNLDFRLDKYQAIKRLEHGQNVGIYAMSGGLMFIDLDVEKGKLKASKEYVDKLNGTLVIKTRNGGLQYYYLNEGIYPNQILTENEQNIGELRTDWYYVVSVGSYVDPDEQNRDGTGTYNIFGGKSSISHLRGFEGITKNEVKKEIPKKEDFTEFQEIGKKIKMEYEEKLKEKGKIRRQVI